MTLQTNLSGRYRPNGALGFGSAPMGNSFKTMTDQAARETLQAAFDAGIRYFDTAPLYGHGRAERRFAQILPDFPRADLTVSTKVGRLLRPDAALAGTTQGIFHDVPPFAIEHDYSADGARRSIEDSLQRLGLAEIDIVYVHDVSPDAHGDAWTEIFATARDGAMKALTEMREEGIIKAWGVGVNTLEPAIRSFQEADPDIVLSATQYSLFHHADALNTLFPVVEKAGGSVVVGAPFNAGFLTGRPQYDYAGATPDDAATRRAAFLRIADAHQVDIVAAALQFSAAPSVVSAVIPGMSKAAQAHGNASAMGQAIHADFWLELKAERLIEQDAAIPSSSNAL